MARSQAINQTHAALPTKPTANQQRFGSIQRSAPTNTGVLAPYINSMPTPQAGPIRQAPVAQPQAINQTLAATMPPAMNMPKVAPTNTGVVGPARMKKGGVVKSSASSRGDGCAQQGKTKGRIV